MRVGEFTVVGGGRSFRLGRARAGAHRFRLKGSGRLPVVRGCDALVVLSVSVWREPVAGVDAVPWRFRASVVLAEDLVAGPAPMAGAIGVAGSFDGALVAGRSALAQLLAVASGSF